MSDVVTFIVAHEAVLAGLGVAILDLIFALNSNLAANGILHQVFVWLQGMSAPSAPSK